MTYGDIINKTISGKNFSVPGKLSFEQKPKNVKSFLITFLKPDTPLSQLKQCKNLEFIYCSVDGLGAISNLIENIKDLKHLKGLSLHAHAFDTIPNEISQLQNLEFISISSNGNDGDLNIDSKIHSLTHIKFIKTHTFSSHDEFFAGTNSSNNVKYKNLKVLSVNAGWTEGFPPLVRCCPNLEVLNLFGLRIDSLNYQVLKDSKISELYINLEKGNSNKAVNNFEIDSLVETNLKYVLTNKSRYTRENINQKFTRYDFNGNEIVGGEPLELRKKSIFEFAF